MKHGKRKLHLERTTIKPLTLDQLARVAGGTLTTPGESIACDEDSFLCEGSMTGHYSVKPCPYSGDCL